MTGQIGCEQSELGGRPKFLYLGHNAVEANNNLIHVKSLPTEQIFDFPSTSVCFSEALQQELETAPSWTQWHFQDSRSLESAFWLLLPLIDWIHLQPNQNVTVFPQHPSVQLALAKNLRPSLRRNPFLLVSRGQNGCTTSPPLPGCAGWGKVLRCWSFISLCVQFSFRKS